VRVRRFLLAALFGAAAFYGVLSITAPPGPGLDPDSMSYLGAAESLVWRGTLRIPAAHWSDADSTSPLAHFPPGFPLAIAVPVALGAPPEQAARAVEALAAFATVALTVWLAAAATGLVAGSLAGAILLVTPGLALDHLQVLSEPLCLALLAATLALMVGSRRPVLSGTGAAAAGLVRYAALSATGAVVLWAFGLEGSLKQRLRRALLAAAPTIVLQSAWVLRTASESETVRSFGIRGNLGPTFRQLGETTDAWLAPSVAGGWMQSVLGIVVGAGAILVLVRGAGASKRVAASSPTAWRLLRAAGLMAGCYVAVVLLSRLFVDETIPFDERLLSPIFLFATVAVAAACGALWPAWRRGVRVAAGLLCVVWLGASARASARAVGEGNEGGWGYANDEWHGSRLGAWLRTEGRGAEIFSNDPAGAWFLTHRPSREVPPTLDPDSVGEFGRVLGERRAVLVRFPDDYEPSAPAESLALRLGLHQLAVFADGAVWGPPSAPTARDSGTDALSPRLKPR
jgi:hypothetical protein